MAMTTNNSINVNARFFNVFINISFSSILVLYPRTHLHLEKLAQHTSKNRVVKHIN
jgi:hypothetical protein